LGKPSIGITDLSPYISAIKSSIDQYFLLKKGNNPAIRLESIKNEIDQKRQTVESVKDSKNPLRRSHRIIMEQVQSDRSLYEDGVISKREFELSYNELQETEKKLLEIDKEVKIIQEQILALESKIAEVHSEYTRLLASYKLKIYDRLDEYKTYYSLIRGKKVIRSPIDGNVSIEPQMQSGTEVPLNQLILKVIPTEANNGDKLYVLSDIQNIGLVNKGQKVYIDLLEYSSQDFGYLEALVNLKSEIPYNEKYMINISLTDGLKTTRNITLPERAFYKGNAEIMVNKKSIATKIWEELISEREKIFK